MTKQMFDKDGNPIDASVARDGDHVRVPVTLMDANKMHSFAARLTDSQKVAFADALNAGKSHKDAYTIASQIKPTVAAAAPAPSATHQRGFAAITDADRTAREATLAKRDARLTGAWKPSSAADATPEPANAQTTPLSAVERRDARLRDAWKAGA